MKNILFAITLLLIPTSVAYAQGCGFRPLQPLGCLGPPVCICGPNGCQWIWTNCR